jgi:ribosomal protein S18 acetylase RimI-like enzyme
VIVQPLERADSDAWFGWLSDAESVYQHIGWHPVIHWLGRPVSLCLKKNNGALAASLLVCPDRLGVTWLQLFAAGAQPGAKSAWEILWPVALESLQTLFIDSVWVMTTQPWFTALLQGSGFRHAGNVVALAQPSSPHAIRPEGSDGVESIQEGDFTGVEEVDHAAFGIPWQLDSDALRETVARAALATLYRSADRILGYQITIPTAQGVHLARLAVHPAHQRQGIGRRLTAHLLDFFHAHGAPRVTVNTQGDNPSSLRLYRALGFKLTGENYPVFRLTIHMGR